VRAATRKSSVAWLPPIVSGGLGLNMHYEAAAGCGALCGQQNPRQDSAPLITAPAESILAGNHTAILASSGVLCTRLVPNHTPVDCPWCSDASFGILRGDYAVTATQRVRNVSWAREQAHIFWNQSPTCGEPRARIPLACVDWPFSPKYASQDHSRVRSRC